VAWAGSWGDVDSPQAEAGEGRALVMLERRCRHGRAAMFCVDGLQCEGKRGAEVRKGVRRAMGSVLATGEARVACTNSAYYTLRT
jgi:hypothetical protein